MLKATCQVQRVRGRRGRSSARAAGGAVTMNGKAPLYLTHYAAVTPGRCNDDVRLMICVRTPDNCPQHRLTTLHQ